MIQGYFDGSGTHTGFRCLPLPASSARKMRSLTFDQQWEKVLDDPRWPTRLSRVSHRRLRSWKWRVSGRWMELC